MADDAQEPAGSVSEKPAQRSPPAVDDNTQKQEKDGQDGPAGGFDATPLPERQRGYTLRFTFHRAENLPMADINSLSSDPYVLAQLNTDTPVRHKEDPPLRFRTPTVRQDTDPTWNEEWVVANVPSSGFKLKLRMYDEDPADKDDRLGNVHITVPSVSEDWHGLKEQGFEVKARSGSKRAYLVRLVAVCFRNSKHIRGEMYVSIENLGRTPEDGQNGRPYTVGPCRWIRHYDPMLGRLVGMKSDDKDEEKQEQDALNDDPNQQQPNGKKRKEKNVQRYNFQANQIQLEGPVPAELYHRYVEFKPWVTRMFTGAGLQGVILGKALHHQHARVYNFDRQTLWGHFPQGPSTEMTKQFLDLVHYDKGGRIFTYVLTLDALWRFTETGTEFGVDLLSKHTMHSDVNIYIAFSGEFFIRRLKHPRQPKPPEPVDETSQDSPPEHERNATHPPEQITGGPDGNEPKDPSYYQLVIDNDSGTYRPNAKLLPILKDFMARSLPGLHIQTLDCQADEEKMGKMKEEQRERKKAEGDGIVYTQGSRSSSFSSSDEEDLDRVQAGFGSGGGRAKRHDGTKGGETGHTQGVLGAGARDAKLKQQAVWEKAKGDAGLVGRGGLDNEEGGVGGHAQAAAEDGPGGRS